MARVLITSGLPYINGIKHLGTLAGSQLPADVYARFQRARGNETLYICATDEHGTPSELAAADAHEDVRKYCARMHQVQYDLGRAFGLSWDWFGRSSSAENRALTQHFADVLENNGLVEERLDHLLYSPADGRFLPDRYIEGTCPVCAYRPARGDQCDNCGSLLDPTDLIDPYSVVSGSTALELRETRHLYLLQSKLQDEIRAWVGGKRDWPAFARSIALKHLDEGLIDRGITRDIAWGVPVTRRGRPRPGFENKVFYVWFDAPIEYIAATQEWAAAADGRDWRRWWRLDEGAEDVRYVQFMGKDNVAFHTVSFPATILGAREPWKTVDVLKALNHLNWYGGKFSTSQSRGLFMDTAIEILPADCWRWHLTAYSPEHSDSVFTFDQLVAAVNKDLADVLGNFVNRTLKFCESRMGGVVPAGGDPGEAEERLFSRFAAQIEEITQQFEAIEVRKAAQAVRAFWVLGNEYLQEAAPWSAIKSDQGRAAVAVRTAINLAAVMARVAAPILPFTAETVLEHLGEQGPVRWPSADARTELARIEAGRRVVAPEVLFRKIEADQIEAWSARFGAGP